MVASCGMMHIQLSPYQVQMRQLAEKRGADAVAQKMTNYQFDVWPDALRGALERFSHFFILPLCKAHALGREVNAVHNEVLGERHFLVLVDIQGKIRQG